ncbi:MAG: hypothetical protein V1663_03100 [archaeon]
MKRGFILLTILLLASMIFISGCKIIDKDAVGQSLTQKGKLEGSTYTAGTNEKLVLDVGDPSKLIVLRENSEGIYEVYKTITCQQIDVCENTVGCSQPLCTFTTGSSFHTTCRVDCGENCGGYNECPITIW